MSVSVAVLEAVYELDRVTPRPLTRRDVLEAAYPVIRREVALDIAEALRDYKQTFEWGHADNAYFPALEAGKTGVEATRRGAQPLIEWLADFIEWEFGGSDV